jgi:hydrogenase small subunit
MKKVGFTKPLHALADVETYASPTAFPAVGSLKGDGISAGAAALAAGIGGAVVGAAATAMSKMPGGEAGSSTQDPSQKE